MFKRISLLAACCLLSAPALAAGDDWTGWYLGAHAGHGSGSSDARVSLGGQWSIESQALRDHVTGNWSNDLDPSGSAYGLQFGYNHQFGNGFVLGAELDYSQLNIDDARATGSVPVPAIPSLAYDFGNRIELEDQASLRARFGYASGRHLFFVTGGWTQVDAEAVATVASNGGYLKAGRRSDTLDGSVWGAGYEYDFGNRWSLRAEYLATDLDELRFDTAYLPGSTFVSPAYTESFRQDVDFDTFRVGLSYRF
jgi:outer membrane immunogenic protein